MIQGTYRTVRLVVFIIAMLAICGTCAFYGCIWGAAGAYDDGFKLGQNIGRYQRVSGDPSGTYYCGGLPVEGVIDDVQVYGQRADGMFTYGYYVDNSSGIVILNNRMAAIEKGAATQPVAR